MSGFVYHRIPANLKGSTLYSLGALRATEPEIYAAAIEKYSWRMELMQSVVAPLGCLWNDVIHLTPLHPAVTMAALEKVSPPKEPRILRFAKIPFASLRREKACWFLPAAENRSSPTRVDASEFSPIGEYRELSCLPAAQVGRWKRDLAGGQPLLFWSETPHVLYAGEISLNGLEQFEVRMG